MLLRPSQHSSFSGTRTARTFHAFMASMAALSTGPSQTPRPCTHMNSPPDRLTPSSRYAAPVDALTILLPETFSLGAAPVDGLGDGEGLGDGDGLSEGLGEGE